MRLKLEKHHVAGAIRLFREGNALAFIARQARSLAASPDLAGTARSKRDRWERRCCGRSSVKWLEARSRLDLLQAYKIL